MSEGTARHSADDAKMSTDDESTAWIVDSWDASKDQLLAKHYEAIGKVATAWAALEFKINDVIWRLAGIDMDTGACLTAQMQTVQSRVRALLALFRLRGGDEKFAKKLNQFFSPQVDPVSRERNRFVHDPLAIDRNRGNLVFRVSITADKRLESGVKEALEDAKRTLQKIRSITYRFGELRIELFRALPPSANIRRPQLP